VTLVLSILLSSFLLPSSLIFYLFSFTFFYPLIFYPLLFYPLLFYLVSSRLLAVSIACETTFNWILLDLLTLNLNPKPLCVPKLSIYGEVTNYYNCKLYLHRSCQWWMLWKGDWATITLSIRRRCGVYHRLNAHGFALVQYSIRLWPNTVTWWWFVSVWKCADLAILRRFSSKFNIICYFCFMLPAWQSICATIIQCH